ncbi:MAG: hypothetical protein AAGF53_03510 [Pseudomonadota bacterium]
MKSVFSAFVFAVSFTATEGIAFDLSEVETKTIRGYEGPSKPKNISNKVLGNAPLSAEGIASLEGRNLRTRFWKIGAGAIVPLHDHANRPAVFTVLNGQVFEYSSKSEKRFEYEAGGLALEEGKGAHWWLNESDEDVFLIAYDVFQPGKSKVELGAVPASKNLELPENKDVDHVFLGAVNFGRHFDDETGDGWVLSTYRTTIEPGGSFADFTAAGEPLQVFVWQGSVEQITAEGALTLAKDEGASLSEGQTGWWKNKSDTPAELYFGVVEREEEIEGLQPKGKRAHQH